MNWGWDSDGHVYESEATFSDNYMDPKYRDRRPRVIDDGAGGLKFLFDDRVFPRSVGPRKQVGGNPVSKDGKPSAVALRRKYDPWDSSEMSSIPARLKLMDAEHIALQINYPTMFLSWPLTEDQEFGNALVRAYNNWIADVSDEAPERLKWVTVINPGDPREAAREIDRTKAMGSVGVMLLGMAGARHVDHPSMEPVWEAAAGLDMPVGLHVGFCCPPFDDLYTYNDDVLVVPFSFTLLMGFQRVVSSGLLDRYPNLRVAFLEAGCSWVEFMSERIAEYSGLPGTRLTNPRTPRGGVNVAVRSYKSRKLPVEYIKEGRLFFGCEADEEEIPEFTREFSADCLLYASDIPHFDRYFDSVSLIEERKDLSDEVKRKLLVDNVARFYGMPVPTPR